MKLFARTPELLGLIVMLAVMAGASPASASRPVQYVHICTTFGPGWFYVPGTDNCIDAVTQEIRDGSTGVVISPGGANLAVEGVALALAMPTPVIGYGDRFAIAGNFAEYEGFGAFGLAAAFRLTNTANVQAGIGYGYMFGTFAARVGLNVALGDGTVPQPIDDSAGAGNPRARQGVSSNFTVFGGLMQFGYPFGSSTRTYDRDWIFGGSGRVAVRNRRGFGAQFDFWSDVYRPYLFEAGQALGDLPPSTALGAALHLNKRIGHSIVGGFASLGVRNDRNHVFTTVGLEDRTTRGPFSLYGQVGYTFCASELIRHIGASNRYGLFTFQSNPACNGGRPNNGVIYGHLSGAYFPTPNLKLEINGGVAYAPRYRWFPPNVAPYPNNDTLWYRWGAQVEYRPSNKPFSFYAEYQGLEQLTSYAPTMGARYMENRILAGIRFFPNDTTLLDSTANGASLTDYNPVYGENHSIE